MIDLAKNVAGANSPNGSKILAIMDNTPRLVGIILKLLMLKEK